MRKKMSTCEKFFREEGRYKTVLEFIQDKRDYHVPDIQILDELLKFFKLPWDKKSGKLCRKNLFLRIDEHLRHVLENNDIPEINPN